MNIGSVAHIDHAVQQANVWLGELMMLMGWNEREQAYRALHVVLPALRQHLPADESADLAAQLPLIVRGLYFETWRPATEPVRDRSGDEFISLIGRAFQNTPGASPSEIAKAVFELLSRHISHGEIRQVQSVLPAGIRRYWPAYNASA